MLLVFEIIAGQFTETSFYVIVFIPLIIDITLKTRNV